MTTRRTIIATITAAPLAAPSLAQAQTRRWRCVTSWSRNLPGPGVTAARLARRITEMSQGELTVDIFAAGEIVPAFSVLDAVSNNTVEMGHSASLFWQGKMPAAPLFTTVPFGLAPMAHAAWIEREGQAMWDELYAPHQVKAFLAGNTGPSSAGWFRKEIKSLADIQGLRIRVTGLGAEIYKRLGAVPVAIPPAEVYPALERGVIDAVEFLAPANDGPLGLHRIAPYLFFPGFNKPNGASELLIGARHWQALPPHLKVIVEVACAAEHGQAVAWAEQANATALRTVIEQGAKVGLLPDEVLKAAHEAAQAVIHDVAATSPLAGRIVESLKKIQDESRGWQRLAATSRLSAY